MALNLENSWTWGVNNPFDSNSEAYRAFKAPENGISIATSGEYRNPGHIWGTGDVGKKMQFQLQLLVTTLPKLMLGLLQCMF